MAVAGDGPERGARPKACWQALLGAAAEEVMVIGGIEA
jgi:hypothetical protein